MVDIELVVKIPEEKYNQIINSYQGTTVRPKDYEIAIINGTPLPKGHGRLIDADKIQFENAEFDTYGDYSRAFDAIDQADTIIEANKTESEK